MRGNYETKFQQKLSLTDRVQKVSNLREAFANYSPADIKLSKTQIFKIVQSGGGFLSKHLGRLIKIRT